MYLKGETAQKGERVAKEMETTKKYIKFKKYKLWAVAAVVVATIVIYGTWLITGFIMDRVDQKETKQDEPRFSADGYYKIYDAQDYADFWIYARKEKDYAKGRLCSDIYLNDTSDLDSWHRVPPANTISGIKNFEGIFDGNGYTIYGLYSEKGYGITDSNMGTIENVTMKDSLIVGKNSSGGICSVNYGIISNCGFQGEVEIAKRGDNKTNSVAGICIENEGEISNCYNLTNLDDKKREWSCFAISNGGEVNCYMRENSGWEASVDGQILALNDRQCLAINDFLRNRLYEYYYPSDTGLFKFEKDVQKTPVNVPMQEALRDEQVIALIWEMVHNKEASFSDFSFEAESTENQDGFILDIFFRDDTVHMVKTSRKDGDISSNELMWQAGTEALDEEAVDSFRHETYRLYDIGAKMENAERLMLYHTGQEAGFFYAKGEILYQVDIWETGGSTELIDDTAQNMKRLSQIQSYAMEAGNVKATEFLQKEPDSMWETAFWGMVGKKLMDNGIDWEEYEIRKLIYDSLKEPEDFHTQEEIGRLTELTIRMSKLENTESLQDLEYLTGLKSLTIYGRGYGDVSVIYAMSNLEAESFPNLTELNMIECGLTDISFVKELPRLTDISFYDNDIWNISPLTACKDLKVLSLAYNEITDITPLSQLQSLEMLGLQYNEITDVDVLCKLKNLTGVNLTGNQINDLSPLRELYKLTALGVADNNITDISPLSELTNLYNLSLDANQIRDISPLSDMKEMEWLGLSWNLIEDFTPIQGMEKLFFLSVTDNPSQDIGDLVLTPDLSIGTWYTDRSQEMEELGLLLNSVFPRQTIEIQDFSKGDINGDGISDVAITGYSGEVRGEDGSISQWGERHVYLFLGTVQGTYTYRDRVDVMGPDEGGIYGDPYEGIAIAGGRLVVKCYGGSNFRWGYTDIYEWEAGGLTPIYELTLNNWVGGTGGYDWYVTDVQAGTEQVYAIAGTLEGNMERVLLSDSIFAQERDRRQSAVDQEVMRLKERLGNDVIVPEISPYFYEPDIGDSYYDYEIHDKLYATVRTPDWVLDKAAAKYLPGAVKLELPIYVSKKIKNNYDLLAGVELPDGFYLGEVSGTPSLLSYERCEMTEEGTYVHVLIYRECKEHDNDSWHWWDIKETLYFYEDTDDFTGQE